VLLAGLLLVTGSALAGPLDGPAIRFDYREIDFGKMPQMVKRDTVFTFTNLGDEPLQILDVKTSCGCTAALASEAIIKPGAKGTVDVTFDSKQFRGDVHKTVTVYSNDPGEPRATLKIRADVEASVVYSPKEFKLGTVKKGKKLTKSVRFAAKKDKGLNIEEVDLSDEYFTWTKKEVAHSDSQVYTIDVSLRPDAPLGRLQERMLVKTGVEGSKPIIINFNGEVVHHFSASPSLVNLGSFRRGKAKGQVVIIKPLDRTSHEVESVQSTHPQIQTRLEKGEGGNYKIFLDVDPNVVPGRLKARLLIRTTDPDEPVLTVPIQGYVRGEG
jgi:hypothetical protein